MPNPYETASQQTQAPANQPAPQQAAPQQVPGTPESKIVPTDKSASESPMDQFSDVFDTKPKVDKEGNPIKSCTRRSF